MRNASQRVLLTGGAGFIGSHLAEALLRTGFQVCVVDSLDDFYARSVKRRNLDSIRGVADFHFVETDVRDFDGLRAAFLGEHPDVVIHLAARAGVRPSIENPLLYEAVNVAGTSNMLELAREFKVSRFIFGSSSSVYGQSKQVPFKETASVLRPISPYAATKVAGELLCHTYSHLYHLATVCMRFFTVYGPRQRPDLAIHKFTALMEQGRPIPIFGDGSMGRDYTYVDDIVAGILAAVQYEFRGDSVPFEVFNLGNSHPVRLIELVEQLEIATGRKAIRNHQAEQPGDVSLTWADISHAQTELGYRPKISFPEGLSRFVRWHRELR